MACSIRPPLTRRAENLALISSTDGTTFGPTASMT